jgi:DNA-binding HxlR family transcriptional regulator
MTIFTSLVDVDSTPRRAIGMLANKWTLPILLQLYRVGTIRFGALQRLLPGVSRKMLTESLRSLENGGFLQRTIHPVIPAQVEYTATERAFALLPILVEFVHWDTEHKNIGEDV